jgi:protein dopey
MQEVVGRAVTACEDVAAMSFGQASWWKRTLLGRGRDARGHQSPSDAAVIPPLVGVDESFGTLDSPPGPESAVDDVETHAVSLSALRLLSAALGPLLDAVIDDKDRKVTLMAQAVETVMVFLGDNNQPFPDHLEAAAELLATVCDYPYAVHAWRKEAWDIFWSDRFFFLVGQGMDVWRSVVGNLFATDRAAFDEILARIGPQSAPTLFTSREAELLTRHHAIRRLSFVLFAGEPDQYQRYAPVILERLVDLLKSAVDYPPLRADVFFALRILLVRVRPASLTTVWPVFITEMSRVLTAGNEDLNTVKQTLLFLDALLALSPDIFSVYRWSFVHDNGTRSGGFSTAVEAFAAAVSEHHGPLSPTERESAAAAAVDISARREAFPLLPALLHKFPAGPQTLRDFLPYVEVVGSYYGTGWAVRWGVDANAEVVAALNSDISLSFEEIGQKTRVRAVNPAGTETVI